MVLNNKTFRVFVSSTFADLKEERNALQREVFPKLRELCMEHGFRFQAIDLRWGVSEEAGLDQQTMKICLEEIERSQRVSPKPNFIVLLGDRYGWRPLPYEIPADDFEEIKKVVSPSDKDFLFWEGDVLEEDQLKKRERWYCRDENAIPPVYCLKPRLVDYGEDASDDEIKEARDLEYKDWEDVEKRLKSILLNAINELGWDKDDPRRFKYESSATEQEIIKGVLKLPEDGSLSEEHVFSFIRKIKGKKGIPFDDNSKDFFDFTASGTIDTSAEEKLIALKSKIDDALPSSNIFDYKTEWEGKGVSKQHIKKLCEDVYFSLEKVISEQIDEFEDKDPLDMEIEAHKEFGEERCKFFIGREDNRAQIKNYLDNPNSKPLIVYGESGSGKSALIAQTVEDSHPGFYKVPVDNVIVRFIGVTQESSDLRSLLTSLCQQIFDNFNFDEKKQRKLNEISENDEEKAKELLQKIEDEYYIPSEINKLSETFPRFLGMISLDKSLFLYLDALDQLSDYDSAHNLTWIPDELPENVHIVISTLKNIFQSSLENRMATENTVEVLPLEDNDGMDILDKWFKDYKRKLTDKQEAEVINKFKVEGLPLYLKLAFEEAKLWKSYTPVPQLESNIGWIINSLFERLSRPENHGEMLVSRCLGYLSAAKNGLTEDEMLDILAMDDDVFFLTKKFHDPTEDKLPVALWSRLYFDLEPYLTERSADETSVFAFYHRQFGEVAKEKYLIKTTKIDIHKLIADYFKKQDLSFDKKGESIYNIRKVSELPYQQIYGEQWGDLEETLTDLFFVEAKCAVGMTYELIKDYNLALDMHPDEQEEKKKRLNYEERLDKYINDLVAYSKGEIDCLDIIPSVNPWTEEQRKKEMGRIINNPEPLDRIKAFSQFVNSQSQTLAKYGMIPDFCLQQAYNSASTGFVAESARKRINKYSQKSLILKDENWLPKFNPHPELTKTLEGQTQVSSLVITPDGKRAISGGQYSTLCVWDLEIGKLLKIMNGSGGSVSAVALTPDGETAISGSQDGAVRVWDLKTGKQKILEGHTEFVNFLSITSCGKTAIILNLDGSMEIWDLKTAQKQKTPIYYDDYKNEKISAMDVTSDGRIAVTGSNDNTVRVWELNTGELINTLEGHTGFIKAVAVTPDGRIAVTGSNDNTVRVWELNTGELINTLEGFNLTIDVVVTPDGRIAVTRSFDKSLNEIVRVWELNTGKILKTLGNQCKNVNAMDLTPDGRTLVTQGGDHTLRVWDIETGIEIQKLQPHSSSVNAVAMTPDGRIAVTGSDELIFWNLQSGKQMSKQIKIGDDYFFNIDTVVLTPDGRIAITKSGDSSFDKDYDELYENDSDVGGNKFYWDAYYPSIIHIWNPITGQLLQILHPDDNTAWEMIPDGPIAINKKSYGHVEIWNLKTAEQIKEIDDGFSGGCAVVVTPDGKIVITGGFESKNVWDLETGQKINMIKDSADNMIITPDGRTLVTGSYDGVIRFWNLQTGEIIKELEQDKDYIMMIDVTPDGRTLVTGSYDGIVCVWDLKTGKKIQRFECNACIVKSSMIDQGSMIMIGKEGSVKSLVLTSDGESMIMIGKDGSMFVWNLKTAELISVFKEKSRILSFNAKADNIINGTNRGEVIYSHLVNVIGFPIVTAIRIWIFDKTGIFGYWDDYIKARCQWCGTRFKVMAEMLDNIREIENQYKKPNGWIYDEAWDDERLISECPECHKKLKFNPFIVDNSDGEFCDKKLSIETLNNEKQEAEKIGKNKSRWKFWK